MATMEEFKGMAAEAAQNAARTAKYVALVSKKRLAILNEQERIRRNYTKLGKVYYKDYVTDEEPDEAEYGPICEEISDSYRRINMLRDEIAQAKATYQDVAGAAEDLQEVELLPVSDSAEEATETPEE